MAKEMRVDARRNHDQLLVAARDVFVERGPGAPLDEIARRAGVGIATLYRRFANREVLLKAVVLDALARTSQAARDAAAEEEDPFGALTRYLHTALELRVSAVIPLVLDVLDLDDDDLRPARAESSHAVEELIDAARKHGSLPEDVSFGDIGMMLVRIARPLPGPIPPALNDQLAHRHLDLFLRGLRTDPGTPLGGPALSLQDLGELREES